MSGWQAAHFLLPNCLCVTFAQQCMNISEAGSLYYISFCLLSFLKAKFGFCL